MSEHCPGCRNSDPTPQAIDPLGVMKPRLEVDIYNPSHGTMSKTDFSLLEMHQKAAMDYARSQGKKK